MDRRYPDDAALADHGSALPGRCCARRSWIGATRPMLRSPIMDRRYPADAPLA